jgi:hypothetical protein
MQKVMFIAQTSGVSVDESDDPVSAEEVWEFCSAGFAESREAHP